MDSREYYETIDRNIATSGQHLQAVFPTDKSDGLPFIYTIGNHGRSLPELLIIGNCNSTFAGILNELCELMRKRGRAFDDGELVNLGGQYPLKIIDFPLMAREEFTYQVGQYYQTDDYRVQQIVLCDSSGHFPDEPACAAPYQAQFDYRKRSSH
jgi:hypothetical protein